MIDNYSSKLSLRETEKAIKIVKDNFEEKLSRALNLQRVSAPLIVTSQSGINDNLNGVERIVNFDIKNIKGVRAEIVQSLAKWKRNALKVYGFEIGEGLYTDMNAIRCDDEVDYLHSIYVDQWDWEMVICKENRKLDLLKDVVIKIVNAVCDTQDIVMENYPCYQVPLCREVAFATSYELEEKYPNLTPKQREYEFTKENKTVCVMQIGDLLKSGEKHDGRAPDYDDWSLNCDILFWQNVIEQPIEISSMGIRVSPESLAEQLKKAKAEDRASLPFHKALLAGELPYTIGGGIGQSRLCMLMLEKAHIGEVQSSIWPAEMTNELTKKGIYLL
jgi:aspartate--ammonia ligase